MGFFKNPRNVFCLGLLIVFASTLAEVVRERASNFYVYSDSTRLFWDGISPYTQDFVNEHGRYFLYTPVFSILFTPFAYMPQWLGPFAWNIMNYTLMFLAVWTLPSPLTRHRIPIFLFLLSIIEQSLFCYQYNLVVCYIFLFAFSLFERGKFFPAILLIMLSATTKVYGIVELGLLFCYPRVWRNIGYAIICGIGLALLPLINMNMESPLSLYNDMLDILNDHNTGMEFPGILYAKGLKEILLPNAKIVQAGTLILIVAGFFLSHRQWGSFRFRAQALAILMGFIILFSDCPETHTYVIALAGYAMAFYMQPERNKMDWCLFWLLFVNFGILPTDVLCPQKVYNFFHHELWMDIYVYTLCWLQLIWWTIRPNFTPGH